MYTTGDDDDDVVDDATAGAVPIVVVTDSVCADGDYDADDYNGLLVGCSRAL